MRSLLPPIMESNSSANKQLEGLPNSGANLLRQKKAFQNMKLPMTSEVDEISNDESNDGHSMNGPGLNSPANVD